MKIRRKFIKTIVLAAIICASVSALSAQNAACELESKTAPLLLNLRLGMSPEQVQTVFSRDLKIKIKKNGERTFFQNYIKKPAPPRLSSVRALYFRFFDRKLYQIEIFYEPRADLQSLEEIKNALSAQTNLPASDWETKNNRAEIVCGQTSLVVDIVLNPRFEMTNETIRAEVKDAREKAKK